MALHRSQILLEERQYRMLVRLAESSQRSISEIARELIDRALGSEEGRSRRRARALARLDELRDQHLRRRGTLRGDPVSETRAERTKQLP